MEFVCPFCKSDNIQRLSVIYEGGLSDFESETKGTAVGLLRGGISLGAGRGKTKGVSQTVASRRAAPPDKLTYAKPLFVIFVMLFIVSLFIKVEVMKYAASIIWIIASAGWIYYAYKHNSKTWPTLQATWEKSYLCNRCNEMFPLEH